MAYQSNTKSGRDSKIMPQYEADSQAALEKTARLKALRLAQEAANPPAVTVKKKPRKSADKSGKKNTNLAEWLSTQQKEGRRN
ncbi:MAG TPA: hypothetical protein VHN11_12230 [Xanthobacteraceae bacterium]|jgi:hypothetical protein|nr:hypothetical protein [Xanthobacteraceae bacterium]